MMEQIRNFTRKHFDVLAWAYALMALGLVVLAWGQHHQWQLFGLTAYDIFPLFGMVAFSLMWGHYMVSGTRALFRLEDRKLNKWYFKITAAVVLGALLIHPSLLIGQLYLDGFGLPPSSYLHHYVAPGLGWAVYLGTVAWLAFMSFELRHWYGKKPWWKYVLYANDVAIWAVYVHGLKLGADVAAPWLLYVWWGFGALLALDFIAIYYRKWFAPVAA